MDWVNERYVRVYTRDTLTWKLLDWRARTTLLHLFRKVDRSGVLEVGDDEWEQALGVMLDLPVEVVGPGLDQLFKRRVVAANGERLVIPNFVDAQEAAMSDAQRQRMYRERRRDLASGRSVNVDGHELSRNVTPMNGFVTDCHEQSHEVTSGHKASQVVTPSDPILPIQPSDPERVSEDLGTSGVHTGGDPLSKLPSAWKPEADRPGYAGLLATVRARGVDPDFELEKFRRHAVAQNWTSVSWHLTWETWLLKARPSKPLPPSAPPMQARERFAPAASVIADRPSADEVKEMLAMRDQVIAAVDGRMRSDMSSDVCNYEVYNGDDDDES